MKILRTIGPGWIGIGAGTGVAIGAAFSPVGIGAGVALGAGTGSMLMTLARAYESKDSEDG